MMLKLEMIRTTVIRKYLFIDCGTLLLTTSTGALFLVDCLVPKMLHMSCDTPFTFPFVFMAAFQTCQVYLKLFSVDDLFPFNLSFPHQRSGQIIFFALFNVFIPSFCRIIMGALCIRKLCPRSSHPQPGADYVSWLVFLVFPSFIVKLSTITIAIKLCPRILCCRRDLCLGRTFA